MLQSLRDNLKGAVAVFVMAIFVVPLVLFGVEQLFVGSVGGTDAAVVNGEGISQRDLQREIVTEKTRLQQQFDLTSSDPRLDDSNLRGPALERLVRRSALFTMAKEGRMGVSKEQLWRDIAQIDAFQIDGQFDYQLFKERISNFYTPATFLDASAKDYVLRQLSIGLTNSSFVTDADLSLIAAITQQKRSFYTVRIPATSLGEVVVDEVEIRQFYDANPERYMEPETAQIDYLELSLDQLASEQTPSEADVRTAYEIEVSEFKARPRYKVAHILVEDGDASETKVEAIQAQLSAGAEFSDLAAEYSDDLGSKDNGGELGDMVEDAFPKAFVAATKTLEKGAVSGPVKTDSGTHFIKVLDISDVQPPSFAERQQVLENQIARQAAREEFIVKMAKMDELTFGVDSLAPAAEALGLEVQTSEPFTRAGGNAIASNKEVLDAAFADDVLMEGQNSRVLELSGDKAVVVRMHKHTPQALQPFASVSDDIRAQLVREKTEMAMLSKAKVLEDKLRASSDAQAVAEELGYEYVWHEALDRSTSDLDRQTLNKAFELPRPQGDTVFGVVRAGEDFDIIGLSGVEDGELSELSEQERASIRGQLAYQVGNSEMANFEQAIVAKADIDLD